MDAEKVELIFEIRDYPHVICNRSGSVYQGEADNILVYITGAGDMFPFDFYKIKLTLYDHYEYIINGTWYGLDSNWTYIVDEDHSSSYLVGSKGRLLSDVWMTTESHSLQIYKKNSVLEIWLIRKWQVPALQFIIPLIAGEILMMISTFAYVLPNIKLLPLYLAFIAFSPLNTLAIQQFLPHRKFLSIPELFSVLIFLTSIMLAGRLLFFDASYKDKSKMTINMYLLDIVSYGAIYFSYYIIV